MTRSDGAAAPPHRWASATFLRRGRRRSSARGQHYARPSDSDKFTNGRGQIRPNPPVMVSITRLAPLGVLYAKYLEVLASAPVTSHLSVSRLNTQLRKPAARGLLPRRPRWSSWMLTSFCVPAAQ